MAELISGFTTIFSDSDETAEIGTESFGIPSFSSVLVRTDGFVPGVSRDVLIPEPPVY